MDSIFLILTRAHGEGIWDLYLQVSARCCHMKGNVLFKWNASKFSQLFLAADFEAAEILSPSIVKAERMPHDATVILVRWTVRDPAVTTLRLEIQEGEEGQWKPVKGASALSRSTTEFKVTDLKADKSYSFRMDLRRPGEQNPTF
ncbi:hypothetical protein ACROYT_G028325 [Oculina patagonica]